jgi:hypothetical protein
MLHGSATKTLPALQVRSAFRQELRVVLSKVTVDGKINEIKAIHPLLADLVLEGRVVTIDASKQAKLSFSGGRISHADR